MEDRVDTTERPKHEIILEQLKGDFGRQIEEERERIKSEMVWRADADRVQRSAENGVYYQYFKDFYFFVPDSRYKVNGMTIDTVRKDEPKLVEDWENALKEERLDERITQPLMDQGRKREGWAPLYMTILPAYARLLALGYTKEDLVKF